MMHSGRRVVPSDRRRLPRELESRKWMLSLYSSILTLLLHSFCARTWIVDQDRLNVVVYRVIATQHRVRDVWHIVSRITFPRDIDFAILQSKGVHEILPKAQKFRSNASLICNVWSSLREASPNRLLYPNHVGQIHPCPRVRNWSKSSILPKKRSVFLQQAFKRAASRSAIEPNSNLVLGKRVR